jgi:penicillin V acylase-like amidase (Ntn superfamily)
MCTGIFIKTKDGNYIFGRTLEFSIEISWFKYHIRDVVGTLGRISGINKAWLTDGLNKSGLMVATFFYPKDFEYSNKDIPGKQTIENLDVNLYLLHNCKTVEDIIRLAPTLNVHTTKVGDQPLSVHWIACDKKGKCVVLEVNNKILTVYKNPLGIFTNSPSFPKQISNLKNFSTLSNIGPDDPREGPMGTGALGLPGDSSSMSRFVRANFFKQNLYSANTRKEGFQRVFGVLHNFDIPVGSVLNPKSKIPEVTEYTVAYSLNNFQQIYAPYGYLYRNNKPVFIDNTPVMNVPKELQSLLALKAKKWDLLKIFLKNENINKGGRIWKRVQRKRTRRKIRKKKKHTMKK